MEIYQFSFRFLVLGVERCSVHVIDRAIKNTYYEFLVSLTKIIFRIVFRCCSDCMKMSNFIHENKPGLCVIGIILSIPMMILGALSILFKSGDTGILLWANDIIGNWAFWVILLGAVMFTPSIYYLVVFIQQLKEFKELIATDSKAIFIKNQDRIEELAWRLHPIYEKMVIDKKAKLKIK